MVRIAERVSVQCAVAFVVEAFAADPARWVAPFFKIAAFEGERAGEEVQASMGMTRPVHQDHLVLIEFDPPEQLLGSGKVFPFRWRAVGLPALFSTFSGRFVVWPRLAGESWIVIEGETGGGDRDPDVSRRAAAAAVRSLASNLKAAFEETTRPV